MDDNTFWYNFWGLVTVCIISIGGFTLIYSLNSEQMFIDNCYEQKMVEGYSMPVWKKSMVCQLQMYKKEEPKLEFSHAQ